MNWSLSSHGDTIERETCAWILHDFPEYEIVWKDFIVPLTFRSDVHPGLISVRSGPSKYLLKFAAAHYGVYFRIAMASKHLKAPSGLRRVQPLYEYFYALHGALKDGVRYLLEATRELLGQYRIFVSEDFTIRSAQWPVPDVLRKHEDIVNETGAYRNLASHASILVMVNGKVPKPSQLPRIKGVRNSVPYLDLALLAQLQLCRDRIDQEYIDADILGSEHFSRALKVLSGIWQGLYAEMARLRQDQQFQIDLVVQSDLDVEYVKQYSKGLPGLEGIQGPTSVP
jgi:hypothetical protein